MAPIVGVICEYNPFHLGHLHQLQQIQRFYGDETVLVCLMSGNFVQRGEPAIFQKMDRAKAAVNAGANLVLELPVTAAISSAEGFAHGGIWILDQLGCIDAVSFGAEHGQISELMALAELCLCPLFDERLRKILQEGHSYAAARQRALEDLGGAGTLLQSPNNILAVEYCKALLKLNSAIKPFVIGREGDYHAYDADARFPSATSVRAKILAREPWMPFVPPAAGAVLAAANVYHLQYGQRAMLARLRAMEETDFQHLPGGAEGLWNKMMKACRQENTVEDILRACKSKRYARTRLMRMLLCAYLGIFEEDLQKEIPYVRVLAMDARGRGALRQIKRTSKIPIIHAGQKLRESSYYQMECRCSNLFTLFAAAEEQAVCGLEENLQIYCMEK